MATPAVKHTNEALAFMTLYKTMPTKVKEEVKEMIVTEDETEDAAMYTSLSLQSWDNNLEENKVWEKLYNDQKGV